MYVEEQSPVRTWSCSWDPFLLKWSCGIMSLQGKILGKSIHIHLGKIKVTASTKGWWVTMPWQRSSLKFFFLNKSMTFPTCREIEKNVEFWKSTSNYPYHDKVVCVQNNILPLDTISEGYNLENMILLSKQFDISVCHKFSTDRHSSHK